MISSRFFISALFLSIAFLFFSCQKEIDTSRDFPRVEIVSVNEIDETGVTFTAKILSEGNSEIIEHGFVWGKEDKTLSIVKSERVTLGSFEGVGYYKAVTTFGLEKNKNYFVKAFVKTKNHTVYSTAKSFFSLGCEPPVISEFEPKTAGWGDTIRIKGENFGFETAKLALTFGNATSVITYASDSLVVGVVPININQEPVSICLNVYGENAVSEESFTFIMPQVNQITPSSATFNDTITFIGTNLPIDQYQFKIKFDDVEANVLSFSSSEVKVIVPLTVSNPLPSISLNVSGVNFTFTNNFTLKVPIIDDLTPTNITGNNRVIKVYGNYFNPEPSLNIVKLGDYNVDILSVSKTEISVGVPYNLPNGKYSLSINTGCFTIVPIQAFSFTNPWHQISDMGGVARWRATAFAMNGKGYVGTGSESYNYGELNDFWEYDPETKTWEQKADFPGSARRNALGFSAGDFGYIGPSGSNSSTDLWEYKPVANSWDQKANYPGQLSNEQPIGFSMLIMGYFFVGDYSKEMWMYNPGNDEWVKKSSIAANGHRYNAAGFIINGKIYVCNGWDANTQTLKYELWEYDPSADSWTRKADFPGGGRNGSIGFAINGKGYVGLGRNISGALTNDMWEYDPATDSWSRTFDFPGGDRRNAVSFQIGDKAFVGTGLGKSNVVKNDFWEFDPNRL